MALPFSPGDGANRLRYGLVDLRDHAKHVVVYNWKYGSYQLAFNEGAAKL
jgi:hypothetical protein